MGPSGGLFWFMGVARLERVSKALRGPRCQRFADKVRIVIANEVKQSKMAFCKLLTIVPAQSGYLGFMGFLSIFDPSTFDPSNLDPSI